MGRHTGSLRRDQMAAVKPIRQEDFLPAAGQKKAPKQREQVKQIAPMTTAQRFGRKV